MSSHSSLPSSQAAETENQSGDKQGQSNIEAYHPLKKRHIALELGKTRLVSCKLLGRFTSFVDVGTCGPQRVVKVAQHHSHAVPTSREQRLGLAQGLGQLIHFRDGVVEAERRTAGRGSAE